MSENEKIQCPVCMALVKKNVIENHVEDCLKPKSKHILPKSKTFFSNTVENNNKKREVPLSISNGTPPAKKSKIMLTDSSKVDLNKVNKLPDESNKSHTTPGLECSKKKIILGKIPLAEQMRPTTFDEYFFSHIGKEKDFLCSVISSGIIPSMLFWGPPGCGKTSLANVISQMCKSDKKKRFVTLSATSAGVGDVKDVVKVAKNERKLLQRKTVLFIDEVHRFNKLQQDTFLPHVEDGTITLLGATTENPSFYLNNALISRCRVVMMKALDVDDVKNILERAISYLDGCIVDVNDNKKEESSKPRFEIEYEALQTIANSTNGDARVALNSLDIILQASLAKEDDSASIIIKHEDVKEEIRRNYVNYDKKGDEHYDIISALHKSIRGSDENAAMYWLARMLEGGEQPLYIARRLVRCASEDIGLADPNALQQAVNGYQACHFIGMPECNVILAQVVTYLSRAPKSIEVHEAYNKACSLIKNWKGAQPKVPLHLRNAPTKLMKEKGYGKDYKYTPKCLDNPEQDYLPEELISNKFFT